MHNKNEAEQLSSIPLHIEKGTQTILHKKKNTSQETNKKPTLTKVKGVKYVSDEQKRLIHVMYFQINDFFAAHI